MKNHQKLLAVTVLAATLGLTGCWHDDNNNGAAAPPTASTEVPDSAGLSTAALVSFILGLGAADESSEPLTLKDTFAVPADETAEPTPLS